MPTLPGLFLFVSALTVWNGFAAGIPGGFEANRGQGEPAARFLWRTTDLTVSLASDHATLQLGRGNAVDALRIQFEGARLDAQLDGEGAPVGRVSYLVGTDQRRWIRDAPTYRSVRAPGIWPGIDVEYRGIATGIEYDLIVNPGADLTNLRMRFEGAQRLRFDKNGDLLIDMGTGEMRQHRPVSFQRGRGGPEYVPTSFVVTGDTVGFRLGVFDRRRPLVIDPAISYSTRLGAQLDHVAALAVDGQGNAYLTGAAEPLPAAPLPPTVIGGGGPGNYVFVTKISSDGQTALYRTYIAGNQGLAIAVDKQGNAYVCGVSGPSFPTTPGAFQTTPPGTFVLKLDATGTRLVYSTYLGGKFGATCEGLAVDASGNVFVTGNTTSPDFPTTAGAFQSKFNGPGAAAGEHAFVSELNAAGSALIYSTLLEGTGSETATHIALDATGNAYVLGSTNSTDFPTTPGALRSTGSGSTSVLAMNDWFVSKLNNNGSALIYSTLLPKGQFFTGMAIDAGGNAYLAGLANCLIPNIVSCDALALKLNPSGTGLLYTTTFGGSLDDSATAVAVDAQGNAYVAGATFSLNFPATADNIQTCALIGSSAGDAFIARLDATGSLASASYLGGSGDDMATAIALDASGALYVTGNTTSTNGSFTATLGPGTAPVFLTKVNFSQTSTPPVTVTCMGNAASLSGGPVAPGEIVSIFGAGLGPSAPVFAQPAGGVLPNSIDGTQVLFDGVPAPLLYIQDRQINAIVPYGAPGKTTVTIQVARGGANAQPVTLPVTTSNPAIFSLSGTGIGPGTVLNQDGSVNSDANPAQKGSIISLFGTGLGQTDPPSVDGTITVPPLPNSIQPGVLFGFLTFNQAGMNITPHGEILYAGPAPFEPAGVFQINVRVPQNAASGAIPLQVTTLSTGSFTDQLVTVAIK